MYSVNIQEWCLKIVIWRKRCCNIWPTCLSEVSDSEGRWRLVYLFFYKKSRPAMANSNKSPLERSGSARSCSGLSCMAMLKRARRHVRIGVAVPELCMRTSHMTYQCSPECNQTWTRILIVQLWYFFSLLLWLEECASCVCVCLLAVEGWQCLQFPYESKNMLSLGPKHSQKYFIKPKK